MAKQDVVQAQVQAIQGAQLQALTDGLGVCYDQGSTDQKASDGTFQQADIDAAVQAAVDPLNAQIVSLQTQVVQDAQALSDAQAKAASDLASVQSALADMTAKEQLEEQAVAQVKASILQVQASFDAIKALLAN